MRDQLIEDLHGQGGGVAARQRRTFHMMQAAQRRGEDRGLETVLVIDGANILKQVDPAELINDPLN